MTETAETPAADWRADAVARARLADRRAKSRWAALLLKIYAIPRLRHRVLRLAQRLEGGLIYSQTRRDILRCYHGVEIGKYSYGDILRPGVLPPGTRVGAYCSVGREIHVLRRNHPVDRPFLHPFFYNSALGLVPRDTIPTDRDNPLVIGHDVWIGTRVTILGGCRRIGNGAVLAAGAVVCEDVAPYTIVGGVPAKPIRMRFSVERIAQLEQSAWWKRDIADVIAATDLPDPFHQIDED